MQDSKLVRDVDRYVGKTACQLISIVRATTQLRRPKSQEPIHKILLVELFEMGAGVMLLPSIQYLKNLDPNMEIHVLTTQTCFPLWKKVRAVEPNRLHCVESGSPFKFLWSAFKTILKLRRSRFDMIVDYELFMRISAIFVGALKARRRGGFFKYDLEGLDRGNFYETKCAYNQNSHISKNYLSLTKAAMSGKNDLPNFKESIAVKEIMIQPFLEKASPNELTKISPYLNKPYIVICPDVGKTLSVRNYPRKYFAEVAQELLSTYPDHQVVMIGTKENQQTSKTIIDQISLKSRCADLCGKTNFDDLIAVISGADLLITNDNGPGHFSTLTGTKTLALFSTDSPFVYGPVGDAVIAYSFYQCSPCISAYNHKASCCDDNRCLQALTPKRVADLAKSILDGKAKFRTINNEIPYLM